MLGSAEPQNSPCRIQISFPSSGKKEKIIWTPAFPYKPFSPRLIHGALFRQRFDVCTTWSKIARLGSYPGIIKCPWILASALHNRREEGGGREDQSDNVRCCVSAAEWLENVTAPVGGYLQRTERGRRWGEVVCEGRCNCPFHNTSCWFLR